MVAFSAHKNDSSLLRVLLEDHWMPHSCERFDDLLLVFKLLLCFRRGICPSFMPSQKWSHSRQSSALEENISTVRTREERSILLYRYCTVRRLSRLTRYCNHSGHVFLA